MARCFFYFLSLQHTILALVTTKVYSIGNYRWNNWPLRYGTEINFYPHPPVLAYAYKQIIKAYGWETFTILYDDGESLIRMLKLMEMAKDHGMVVQMVQLDQSHTENYR